MEDEKNKLANHKMKEMNVYTDENICTLVESPYIIKNKKRRQKRLLSQIIFVPAIICLCLCAFICFCVMEKKNLFDSAFEKVVKMGFLSPDKENDLPNNKTETTFDSDDKINETDTQLYDSEYDTDEEKNSEKNTDESCGETFESPTDEPFVPDNENKKYMDVISSDLSESQKGIYFLKNNTPYNPDAYALSRKNIPTMYDGIGKYPLVLIIHTHTSESYSEDGIRVDVTDGVKNNNGTQSVVRVGEIVTNTLCTNKVPAIHCTVIHDKDSNMDSYKNAASSIKWILSVYPTIRYIVDIHRSSESENMNMIRTEGYADGEACAQIGITVGTGTANWQDNLSLSLKLREMIDKRGNICRPITLNANEYNAEYSYYYLTIDMGSCGNTLDEAALSAKILGDSLSKIIKNNMS